MTAKEWYRELRDRPVELDKDFLDDVIECRLAYTQQRYVLMFPKIRIDQELALEAFTRYFG